ncbi:hypothetical protein PROVRUST_05911 [Providencia rustigianii DSM 4541]|uniref:Uncharacterized protein n=1 Tax=Providencia rustigianii DSM 4541 TaxID=500637 RepID=D1P193_9GAMM|nr:hypothetical protein PROVRUST_05911 [Providencia rustigianii DSM 4541]
MFGKTESSTNPLSKYLTNMLAERGFTLKFTNHGLRQPQRFVFKAAFDYILRIT